LETAEKTVKGHRGGGLQKVAKVMGQRGQEEHANRTATVNDKYNLSKQKKKST